MIVKERAKLDTAGPARDISGLEAQGKNGGQRTPALVLPQLNLPHLRTPALFVEPLVVQYTFEDRRQQLLTLFLLRKRLCRLVPNATLRWVAVIRVRLHGHPI